MNNFFKSELPPYQYLSQILNNSPLAAATYVEIWRHKDVKNKLTIDKDQVRNQFLVAPTKFRNDLYTLVRSGLVSVEETRDKLDKDWYKMDIELVAYGEE
jgi:hypothetical protein